MSDGGASDRLFSKRTALAVAAGAAVVVALVVLRRVADVLLTAFAGILLAVLFDALASWLAARTRMPRGAAVTIAVVAVLGLIVLAGVLAGPNIVVEIAKLGDRVPVAFGKVTAWLAQYEWGRQLLAARPEPGHMLPIGTDVLKAIGVALSGVSRWFVRMIIVLVVAIHIAANPGIYLGGVTRLFPQVKRARAREVAAALGRALRWWLVGRAAAMVVIGALTWVGLSIAGIPVAFSLAVIAALFAFVPILGPVLGAIPAILVGLAESPIKALYVIVVFVVVQLLETYVITPLIEQRAVSIPAALLIAFQVVMGVLFGGLGIFLATPVLVTIIIIVQMGYIEGVLGDRLKVLGDHR